MARDDINFVHTLQAQANASTNKRVDVLFILIVLFFAGFIVWAAISEIDELARGEGKVIPSEKIQTIQNLDGGIVSEILVKEGSFVKVDQPLMKVDTTRFQASVDENKQAYYGLLAAKVRLEQEYDLNIKNEVPLLEFPPVLKKSAPSFIGTEQNLFNNRVEEFRSALNILETQLGQKIQELVELRAKRTQLEEALKLAYEENDTIKRLVRTGAKSKFDLISSKKELNTIKGDINTTKISIPKAQYAVDEAKNRIIEKLKNFKSEALKELQVINTDLKKYENILISEEDKLDKTVVKSPVNGFIKQININTIGGVIKSGMDLIEIVPQSDTLLVEAKIDPKDIAFISPELKAIVKITAYDFAIYGGLDGKIVEISADSIIDKESKDQKSYYKVVVKTNKNYLEKDGKKLPIIPGMIASVDIITGQKTILDFILKPILKTKQDALHER